MRLRCSDTLVPLFPGPTSFLPYLPGVLLTGAAQSLAFLSAWATEGPLGIESL